MSTPEIPQRDPDKMLPVEHSNFAPSAKPAESLDNLTDHDLAEKTAIIGDSIGVGIDASLSQITKARGRKHFSVGGTRVWETVPSKGKTYTSVRDQLNLVDPQKYNFLIIQGGTNSLPWHPAEKIADDLINIYKLAVQKGFKKVMLVTIPPHREGSKSRPWKAWALAVNEQLRKKCHEQGINLFDLHQACETNPNFQISNARDKKGNLDQVHPSTKSYPLIAEMMLQGLRQGRYEYTPDQFARVLASEISNATPTIEIPKKPRQTRKLIKAINKLPETSLTDDQKKLREAGVGYEGVRKIRFERVFNQDDKSLDKKERITRTYDEMVRRLRAYTKVEEDEKGKWFVLNYSNIGGDAHEYGIGLGDILVDPNVREVIVWRQGESPFTAHRGTVPPGKPHAGRLGFLDENNNYVATFTGDRFKTVTEKKNYYNADQYIAELDRENGIRGQNLLAFNEHPEQYAENYGRKKPKSRPDKITNLSHAILEEVRKQYPDLNDQDLYKKALELANAKALEATGEDKTHLEIVAVDYKNNIDAINLFPSLDLSLYKRTIWGNESGARYNARNDTVGKKKPKGKKGSHPWEWAFGKYQFLSGTANTYLPTGSKLVPTNEASIQNFLGNHALQEEIMNRFTLDNLRLFLSKPEEIRAKLLEQYNIYQILAAMHFGGDCINWSKGTIPNIKDWLGTYMLSKTGYLAKINNTLRSEGKLT